MEVKQILVAFWWLVAITVVGVSFVKIDAMRVEKDSGEIAQDIALIVDRMGTLDVKANVTYFLDEGFSAQLRRGNVELLNNGVVVSRYVIIDKGKVVVKEIDGGIVLIKDE